MQDQATHTDMGDIEYAAEIIHPTGTMPGIAAMRALHADITHIEEQHDNGDGTTSTIALIIIPEAMEAEAEASGIDRTEGDARIIIEPAE